MLGFIASCRIFAAYGFSSCEVWADLPCDMWDLSSLTRDKTHIPCPGSWILNHWTTREGPLIFFRALTTLVKNPHAMQETHVRSLGWEDPLEKEMATHSSILAWRIPWTEKPGGLQSMGLQELGTT